MTAKSTPLDLIAIRQHILAELGVVAWALKGNPTIVNSKTYQSRLIHHDDNVAQSQNFATMDKLIHTPISHSPISEHQIHAKQHSQSQTNQNQSNPLKQPHKENNYALGASLADNGKVTHALPHAKPLQTTTHIPNQTHSTPIIQTALPEMFMGITANVERFELLGISYQNWAILADNAFMNATQKSIWLSLAQKLTQEGALSLQVHYPLVANEYREYENFAQGTHSLLGFLLRLCANKPSLKLALLTPLPDGIDLGNLKALIETTPTLQEMGQNPQAKKTFWQLLHS